MTTSDLANMLEKLPKDLTVKINIGNSGYAASFPRVQARVITVNEQMVDFVLEPE